MPFPDHFTPMTFPVSFAVPALAAGGSASSVVGSVKRGDIVRSVEAFFPGFTGTGFIAIQGSTTPLLVGEISDGGWGWFRPADNYSRQPADANLVFVVDEVFDAVTEIISCEGVLNLDRKVVVDFIPLRPGEVPQPVVPGPGGGLDILYSFETQYAFDPSRTVFQDGVRDINVTLRADLFTRRLVNPKYGDVTNNKAIFISRLFKRDRLNSIVIGLDQQAIPSNGLAVSIGTLSEPGKIFQGRIFNQSNAFFAEIKVRDMMVFELQQDMNVYLFLPEAETLAQTPGELVFGRINYVRN
jgi:hypothetical protein